ncbi:MAG: FecR domain-containing protein [Deltaproteobacteria bacterium]|nr:FecR domain-containing protein [Deltaproteobacteria bacterium]
MLKMRNGNHVMTRIFLWAAIVGALALHAGNAGAAKNALLTSVKGEASNPTGSLDSHANLGDGEHLQTGDESGCSVLLDENAVVELCGQTRLSFSRDEKRGNRIVNIESGTVRMIVEPRDADERIEIHTPAAIATILGTIIYVTVDPVTGEATFTSSDSRINIRARDDEDCTPIGLPLEAGMPQCAEGTTIGRLEQLTITPGEKAGDKKEVTEEDLALLGGCLFDFHDIAAEIDRMAQANKATQRVVAVDIASVNLPPVSLEEGPTVETESGDDIEAQIDPFDDPSQEEQIRESFEPPQMEVPDCGPIPCEQGSF